MRSRLAAIVGTFALLGAVAPAWAAKTTVVTVTSNSITPADIRITKGDVVQWQWQSGVNRLASGVPSIDMDAGTDWDTPLDASLTSSNPQIEVTFDKVGTFHYYSKDHPGTMLGTVTVLDGTPVDRTTWGYLKKMFENPAAARLRR